MFAIPSYYIVKDDKWLCCFLSFSVFASLLWHFSKEDFYNEQFEQFDIVHQNLLIAISVCLILYESIPQFILGVLFVYTIFLSIFGLNEVDGIPMYEILYSRVDNTIVYTRTMDRKIKTNIFRDIDSICRDRCYYLLDIKW